MMRKLLGFTILFFLITTSIQAQTAAEVDSIVKLYPKRFSSSAKLAERIQSDFSTDFGKARAIFSWIAFNVSYDVKSYLYPKKVKPIQYKNEEERLRKVKKRYDKMIAKVLHKRKAVCSGYSELFNNVALQVGLESQVNSGDAKTKFYDIGRRRIKVSHAWNSVKINGDWKLLDVTWGAGYVDIKKEKFYKHFHPLYFDMEPQHFFMEHYPQKGIWQDTMVDKTEFLKAPLVQDNILNGTYKILEPKTGVIDVCSNEKVTFKIQNLIANADIEYTLRKKGAIGIVAEKNQIDEALQFDITIDKTIGRYLTLYVDGNAIATFKINRYNY